MPGQGCARAAYAGPCFLAYLCGAARSARSTCDSFTMVGADADLLRWLRKSTWPQRAQPCAVYHLMPMGGGVWMIVPGGWWFGGGGVGSWSMACGWRWCYEVARCAVLSSRVLLGASWFGKHYMEAAWLAGRHPRLKPY